MNIYLNAHQRNPNTRIRVHPLLLSLSETIAASDTNPEISNVSEDDKRVLGSIYYTPPSALPPLEMHISRENGLSHLSNRICYVLMSVAGCQECMASAPQNNPGGEGNSSQVNSAATSHPQGDNAVHMGGASLNLSNKAKKRQRSSSGVTQGNLSSTRGPKAAAAIRKAKGKRVQKAGSQDVNPSSTEQMSYKSSQGGRDQEVEPRTLTGGLVQDFSDDIHCLLKTQMTI
jgi:hypothetical protein